MRKEGEERCFGKNVKQGRIFSVYVVRKLGDNLDNFRYSTRLIPEIRSCTLNTSRENLTTRTVAYLKPSARKGLWTEIQTRNISKSATIVGQWKHKQKLRADSWGAV